MTEQAVNDRTEYLLKIFSGSYETLENLIADQEEAIEQGSQSFRGAMHRMAGCAGGLVYLALQEAQAGEKHD